MGIYPFEDSQNYSPYIHTPNDLIGISVNSFEMSQQYCQMNIACLAEIANPVGDTPQVYCNPVTNFFIDYPVWKEMSWLYLEWTAPEEGSTGNLDRFDVYRDNERIASVEIDPDPTYHYGYVDSIAVGDEAEYFVMAVYSDGCEAASEILLGAGISSIQEHDSYVSIYPNPAENQLNIVASGLQRIFVYNVMGQMVEAMELERQNQYSIPVEGYAPGLYTLQIITANGVYNRNVVVK